MSGEFDPYHRWLGISPKDQPANHYRLLSLDLFERDPEVIRDAAERQMGHVRTYQLGQYQELSQRILNELAAAKACLLDPDRKAAYDAALRAQIQPAPPVMAPPPPVATTLGTVEPPAISAPSGSAGVAHDVEGFHPPRRARYSSRAWLLVIGGVAAILLLTIGLIVFFLNGDAAQPFSPLEEARPEQQTSGGAEVTPEHHAEPKPSAPVRPAKLVDIPDQTIDEGSTVRLPVEAANPGTSGGTLRFSLGPNAPTGAAIDARTGVFTWTPAHEQAGTTHSVTVNVQADGAGDLRSQAAFRVFVEKLARPLIIHDIKPQTVSAGRTNRLTIKVTNLTGPPNEATLRLVQAPSWVSLDATTGRVTCSPADTEPEGTHLVTVRATNDAAGTMAAEKTFTVTVVKPLNAPRQRSPQFTDRHAQTEALKISLPSGKVLTSATFDVRDIVRHEVDTLLTKCGANSFDAIKIYPEGSKSTTNALANLKGSKLAGPAVLFHPGGTKNPKQFVVYDNGRWDGLLATWDAGGKKGFWCNYADGRRQGWCCLFKEDVLAAVLECTGNKIDAVCLIAANQVTKSFADVDQAAADDVAGPVLQEIDAIEERLKAEDRLFQEQVKQAVQERIAARLKENREAIQDRLKQRAQQRDQEIKEMQRRFLQGR